MVNLVLLYSDTGPIIHILQAFSEYSLHIKFNKNRPKTYCYTSTGCKKLAENCQF